MKKPGVTNQTKGPRDLDGAAPSRDGNKRGHRRAVTLSAVIGSSLVIALSLLFTSAYGAQSVATRAFALQRYEAVLAHAAAARAAVAQAVLFSSAAALGLAEESAAIRAAEEVNQTLDGLDDVVSGLQEAGDESDAVLASTDRFLNDASAVLAELEAGRQEEAERLSAELTSVGYDALVAAVTAGGQTQLDAISATNTLMGRVREAAAFLVAFLIPVASLLIFRERSMRERKGIELKSARAVNRAKDEFIANISHELRTPLTSISGFADVLQGEEFALDTESAELIGLIGGEARELSRMVDDLLTASRLDAGALKMVIEEVAILPELLEVVVPFNRSGEDIGVDCDNVLVSCDRVRLRQIVRNLISNARRHGGPTVRLEGRSENGQFRLSVIDDGPGVAPQVEGRLFQRFAYDESGGILKGSVGLGLSIVKSLAERMRGSITYQRIQGLTRFDLELPLGHSPEPDSGQETGSLASLVLAERAT